MLSLMFCTVFLWLMRLTRFVLLQIIIEICCLQKEQYKSIYANDSVKYKREYDFILSAFYDHVLDQSEKTKQVIHVIFVLRRRRREPAILRNCWEKRTNQPQDILLTFHQKLTLPISLKSPSMAVFF